MYSGHKFYQFQKESPGGRSTQEAIHSQNYKKSPMQKLECVKAGNMPGTTIPVAMAARATNPGNNFISPNSPDVMRMTKGCKIIGIA